MTVPRIWWAFIVAALRSKFGLTALAVMLAVAGWELAHGHTGSGIVVVAVTVVTYARLPALLGAWLGVRKERSASR